jgi:hypothetical protein
LLHPNAFPHRVGRITLLTTHISWVLLAGPYAYKLKRPVDLGFVDYSTKERRERFCHEEVRLNRRLTQGVYLGVVAVVRTASGVRLGGDGEVIDHAVKMRRLPQRAMLNRLLARGAATPEQAAAIGRLIARFHDAAPRALPADPGGAATVRENTAENFRQMRQYVGRTITPQQDAVITAYTERFLQNERGFLDARHAGGWVRDVHGDLRSDNICLGRGIQAFDCIEFSRRLRIEDVAAEVAFLAMDFDWWGYPDLARAFVGAYAADGAGPELSILLPFYQCYRAYVRGKVESLRLDQPDLTPAAARATADRARRYFALAATYARPRPTLLLVGGLSGTGKSVIAGRLGAILGWPVYSSDRLRKAPAGVRATDSRAAPYGAGLYAPAMTEAVYRSLRDHAAHDLRQGRSVILDATFLRQEQRAAATSLATAHGAAVAMILCAAPKTVVKARLAARAADATAVSDAGWPVYLEQRRRRAPVGRSEGPALTLRTGGSAEAAVRRALRWLTQPGTGTVDG